MTDIIIKKDGMIDKYMGDCIMAVWNAPLDIENQEHKAVYSALYMLSDLKDLNEELSEEGLLPINIGIGINTGEAVVGNMGSDQRFDYSVLGDPVNLGARLEGQSKSYGVELVVSENTKQGIDDKHLTWILLDKLIVKGKKEPVNIYTVFDIPVFTHTVRDIQDAWDAYVKGEWDKSINIYSKITFSPLEDYSKIMISRCKKMKQLNPSDWEGIWEATTK
jgi:adenylate cyclase